MRDAASLSRPLLHLHIRKTGGTSLRHYLFNRFQAEECLLRSHWDSHRQTDPNNFRLVCGHTNYDWVRRFSQAPVRVVGLRDPVDRSLSEFYYQRSEANWHHLHTMQATRGEGDRAEWRFGVAEILRRHELAGFIKAEPELAQNLLGNVQTRFLAGAPEDGASGATESADRLFERAVRHLRECEVVMLTERVADSLKLLCRTLGWEHDPLLPRERVTSGRIRVSELDQETLAAMRELAGLDLKLYLEAQSLFERRFLGAEPAGPGLLPVPSGDAMAGFTFDQAIPGRGWHRREKGDAGWFAWTADEATLQLRTGNRPARRLRLRVVASINPVAIEGLRLEANGELVPLHRVGRNIPTDCDAIIPSHVMLRQPGRLSLLIRSGHTARPCDLNPESRDPRQLGVAFSRVQLLPE